MTNIIPFTHDQFGEIRTTTIDGEPWFVAVDVCRALDIINHKDAIKRLDDDEKSGVVLTDPHGREQSTNCVNEPGLYTLVLGSRKKEAKAFKRWIAHDVIPSIRKHGAYITPAKVDELIADPDTFIRLLTEYKAEREQRKALEEKVLLDEPKVTFADAVVTAPTTILIGDLAKLLRQNGFEIGQNRLFERLRNEGFLIKRGDSRNMPTQYAMERGLFEVKENTVELQDGSIRVTRTTKVTGKGQVYFIDHFLNNRPIPETE